MSIVFHNQIGTDNAPIDPKLAPLANYGGSIQTMGLLPGSPAAGAGGNVTGLAAAITSTATTISVFQAAVIASTPGNYTIQVDGEQMLVTNVNLGNNTLTVVRGYNGTTATSHSILSQVYLGSDERGVPLTSPPAIGAFQPQLLLGGGGSIITLTATAISGLGYNGPVALSSSDGQQVSPAVVAMTNGGVTASATLEQGSLQRPDRFLHRDSLFHVGDLSVTDAELAFWAGQPVWSVN